MLDLPELRQVCHALGIALPDFVNRYEGALEADQANMGGHDLVKEG